jgi:hypothetical protein
MRRLSGVAAIVVFFMKEQKLLSSAPLAYTHKHTSNFLVKTGKKNASERRLFYFFLFFI